MVVFVYLSQNMRLLNRLIIAFFIIATIPAVGYFVMESSGQTINIQDEKVVYNLPYPGILSDNPIYLIKVVRDRIIEFLTRDPLKKSQLYLLNSDKRAAMALALAHKGKTRQAIDAASKAEKYFLKIIYILKDAKRQGNSPPSSFIETLKLANAKHKEVIAELLKILPAGSTDELSQVNVLNEQVRQDLLKL